MPSFTEVREGIAQNLRALPGWHVSPYMMSAPTPPAVHVFPDEIEYDKTMGRGHDDWIMVIQAFVGAPTDIGAQLKLDALLASEGGSSVKELVEADPTLGGAVDDLRVESASGYRMYPRPNSEPVLGCEWRVRVLG